MKAWIQHDIIIIAPVLTSSSTSKCAGVTDDIPRSHRIGLSLACRAKKSL